MMAVVVMIFVVAPVILMYVYNYARNIIWMVCLWSTSGLSGQEFWFVKSSIFTRDYQTYEAVNTSKLFDMYRPCRYVRNQQLAVNQFFVINEQVTMKH